MPYMEETDRYQKALLWQRTGYDSEGAALVSAREELTVRWEDHKFERRDALGNITTYDARVHVVKDNIPIGSIMWQGGEDDVVGTGDPDSDLFEVQTYHEVPDIKDRVRRRVVYLLRYHNSLPDYAS